MKVVPYGALRRLQGEPHTRHLHQNSSVPRGHARKIGARLGRGASRWKSRSGGIKEVGHGANLFGAMGVLPPCAEKVCLSEVRTSLTVGDLAPSDGAFHCEQFADLYTPRSESWHYGNDHTRGDLRHI